MMLSLLRVVLVSKVWVGLVKLKGLSDAQLVVVQKYACYRCEHFGFNVYSRFWDCDARLRGFWSGCARDARVCSNFCENVGLLFVRLEHEALPSAT